MVTSYSEDELETRVMALWDDFMERSFTSALETRPESDPETLRLELVSKEEDFKHTMRHAMRSIMEVVAVVTPNQDPSNTD